MTLVIVPCWWDGNTQSLLDSILFQRPDIHVASPSAGVEIPLNPPRGYFSNQGIPGIGELMLASFLKDDFAIDPGGDTSWWMGEKYDGIRCCWNPVQKVLYSRSGKILHILTTMSRLLPPEFFDGELWINVLRRFGRSSFVDAQAVVSASSESMIDWHSLRLMTFDVPALRLRSSPFESRYRLLASLAPAHHHFLVLAFRMICSSSIHLREFVQKVIDAMGEGLILRRVGSCYENGRTSSLLKLKAFEGDKEGVIVARAEDSVDVRLPDGITFKVPKADVLTQALLSIGDIVSFSCESHARRQAPVNPKIYRIRRDLTWPEVVRSSLEERKYLNESSAVPGYTSQPIGHWTAKNMRLFLEKFARSRGQDPISPETWYSTPSEAIRRVKGGASVLDKMKGGYFHTLNSLFPEIGLERSKFGNQKSWYDIENRRRFFESYAESHGFDPEVPENWYSQPSKSFFAIKGAHRLLSYHNYSISQAMMDLFPNVKFNHEKFTPSNYLWHESRNRRKFFIDYARHAGFDPFNPSNWYSLPAKDILSVKGARRILHYHGNSVSTALIDLFPDVKFSRAHFVNYFWRDAINRRKFFEEYAKEGQFDPLNPDNWYPQRMDRIMAFEGARVVMYYYGHSVVSALLNLFPNIGLDRSKFHFNYASRSIETQKKFFEDYARENNFDPLIPENWYNQSSANILITPGASKAIRPHGRSIIQSLMNLFPDIGLDRSKFAFAQLWRNVNNRRHFFEEYAREKGFNPRSREDWYAQPLKDIIAAKGSAGVLAYHNRSVPQALVDLFPEIGLQQASFIRRKSQL